MAAVSAITNLPPAPVSKNAFETTALAADIGDAPHNLMDAGGSFYDVAVLNANFSAAGVASFPMAPMDVQDRLGDVFGPHSILEGEFRAAWICSEFQRREGIGSLSSTRATCQASMPIGHQPYFVIHCIARLTQLRWNKQKNSCPYAPGSTHSEHPLSSSAHGTVS